MHDENPISIAIAWTVLGFVVWVFFFVKLSGPKTDIEKIMIQHEIQQQDRLRNENFPYDQPKESE